MAKRSKKPKLRQRGLYEEFIVEPPPENGIMTFDFETFPVRWVMVKGEPWAILADVARVLGYKNAQSASQALRPKDKDAYRTSTLGGEQEFLIVSKSGLYRLILRSNKPEAERFQDWVTDEVLPSIDKTGRYAIDQRVAKIRRKNRCDQPTAVFRLKVLEENKTINDRFIANGYCRNAKKGYHDAISMGHFGRTRRELVVMAGLAPWRTILDHMSALVLSQDLHAKQLIERCIAESAEPLTSEQENELAEKIASQISTSDLKQLGDGYYYGVNDTDARRGPIIDVRHLALPSK